MADLGQRIFKTIDGGANWIRVFTGPAVVTSIIIDPIDPNSVYATTLAGFLKSINAGATWSLMSDLSSKPLWDVAIDPTNHELLYVATNTSGVWRSPDAGASWQPTGPLSAVPYSVSVDPSPHTPFWSAPVKVCGRVRTAAPRGDRTEFTKSDDAGQTWLRVLDLPAWSITIVGGDSQVVYATTKREGVYRSLDGGRSWEAKNDGITDTRMGRSAPVR